MTGMEHTEQERLMGRIMEMAFETGYITKDMVMHRFRWGFARVSMLFDRMEEAGLISSCESRRRRRPLVTPEQWQTMKKETS